MLVGGGGAHLLENLPHDAGGIPGARDEVDATEIQRQARNNIFTQQTHTNINMDDANTATTWQVN